MTARHEPERRPMNGNLPVTVRAAGAVLCRPGSGGAPEVAVVHRPRHDDWSLPKGKLDPGETSAHAAVREVREETGFGCVLTGYLTRVHYEVPAPGGGRTGKRVDYFTARAEHGEFAANDEVDELVWVALPKARELMTYPQDRRVLDEFAALPEDPVTLLLVRHAKAGRRAEFDGDDTMRPLSGTGRRQRDALHSWLPLFGPERVYSAPRLRCAETVRPVAADLGIEVAAEPLLSEEGYRADPEAAVHRFLRIAAGAGTAVVCSQGGVIPDLVARLARSAERAPGGLGPDAADPGGLVQRGAIVRNGVLRDGSRSRSTGRGEGGDPASAKGSVWTLRFSRDAHSGNGSGPLLRLVSADYLADPSGR
ncbi:NUDIX hydrolase [Saccharopolyspora sp. NPDC047091]|uniref:NUDIX hydrolase n=1 Tax=Saccharopolyspora sp. NPDC047091 TaxID=3155924 RepID=UPI00340981DA